MPEPIVFQSLTEQLLIPTVYIETEAGGARGIGTGFLYAVETDQGTTHWLVTNKHVLAGADRIKFRMVRAHTHVKGPRLGEPAEAEVSGAHAMAWQGHPDSEVDVAVMPFVPVLNGMVNNGREPFFITIPAEMAMTSATARDLDAIEEVVFIGYPNGLYDTANLTPVARRGITATHPGIDYRGQPAFLIDGSVFPGSSGSPVFIANQGSYAPKAGGLVAGSRAILLGVLAAVHVREASGEIVTATGPPKVSFQDPLNLGIVYKASAIDECIDTFLGATGLTRVSAPSEPTTMPEPTGADESVAGAAVSVTPSPQA
jgi:V8-like Glu-specific endopeptidase